MNIAISGTYSVPTNLSKIETNKGVFLNVDTSAEEAVITLPPAGTYSKIVITDASNNASNFNIKVNAFEGYDIEGKDNFVINKDGGSVTLEEGDDDSNSTPDIIEEIGSETITLTGTIASGGILSIDEEFVFLAALGAKKRPDFSKFRLTYNPGLSQYTTTTDLKIYFGGTAATTLPKEFIESTEVVDFEVNTLNDIIKTNTAVTMDTVTKPTGGTGTIDYLIEYKVIDYNIVA